MAQIVKKAILFYTSISLHTCEKFETFYTLTEKKGFRKNTCFLRGFQENLKDI